MFGESDSESPRVGSPWDTFMAGSPSRTPFPMVTAELELKTRLGEGVPKLVPEVEYGNVEYKLKLLNPSPERFTRLVTQMKWRLLEGGGQAYYELGVADSGQLVGLPRKDLEQSLETLEMMAGDIGASVIIVKEIEVPAALIGRGMNFALGIPQRTPILAITEGETETSTTTETEMSATDDDDDDDDDSNELIPFHHTNFATSRSHPERPDAQSSPAIQPSSIALPEPEDSIFHLDFEIEIASVYKPRPHRARPPQSTQSKYTKRGAVSKPKSKPKQQQRGMDMDPTTRAVEKRTKRDARRDQRRRALLSPDVGIAEDTSKTAADLQELHVKLDPLAEAQSRLAEMNLDKDGDDNTIVMEAHEPRLIVEVLVVRKLALEEAFLDFGGFALEI
ncbi:hypothetical protein K439DRAFT_1653543 [Ramaria rubella]|nr:hypothetical protein K439DRAFT_1653543 [Ramaria rubella]